MLLQTPHVEEDLASEAMAIVALAFRNGPIEDVHAGVACPTCRGKPQCSHITDAEMKQTMKAAVNQVYRMLWLRRHHFGLYRDEIAFGLRYTRAWDQPEAPHSLASDEWSA
jgi:hypothetical protein